MYPDYYDFAGYAGAVKVNGKPIEVEAWETKPPAPNDRVTPGAEPLPGFGTEDQFNTPEALKLVENFIGTARRLMVANMDACLREGRKGCYFQVEESLRALDNFNRKVMAEARMAYQAVRNNEAIEQWRKCAVEFLSSVGQF